MLGFSQGRGPATERANSDLLDPDLQDCLHSDTYGSGRLCEMSHNGQLQAQTSTEISGHHMDRAFYS